MKSRSDRRRFHSTGRAACVPLAIALGAALAGCSGTREHDEAEPEPFPPQILAPSGPSASASIIGRSGSSLSGRALFTELSGGGVRVQIWIEDAPPGKHAVHVHEDGDCSAKDGSSAGAHFNPGGHPHGGPHGELHHAGDLGNMWVGADGRGVHDIFSHDLTVTAGSQSVVGRAIVVHADPDDLVSQPAGAAGARIGCGEIE